MKCRKCGGCVVYEPIFVKEEGGWVDEWRCLHCGERFFPEMPTAPQRRRELKLIRKEPVNENLCGG